MQNRKHTWVLPILLCSFILYNVGIPLFVHFCASKNTITTSVLYHKDPCKREKNHSSSKKSCCEKKPHKEQKSTTAKKEPTNCYGEYFAPSDCCKLTYQIKQNNQKYVAEASKNIKKDVPCTINFFHRYIAGIPAPICKNNKKNTLPKSSSFEVPLIEYFPLRL
jgi:hypothetical protein